MNSARERPAISAARPRETVRNSYHLTAATSRNSRANAAGSLRSAANAPSGISIVICTMLSIKRAYLFTLHGQWLVLNPTTGGVALK